MAERAQEIFERLGRRGFEPRLHGISQTVRFDITGAGSWHIAIEDGSITVTQRSAPADCVLELDEDVFLRLARGQQNPLTAFMRGLLNIQGDPAIALKIAGLFPAAAPTHERAGGGTIR